MPSLSYKFLKSFFDRLFSLLLILLLSPLNFSFDTHISFAWLTHPFVQSRPGYNSKPFPIIKFRTMTSMRTAHGALLPDSMRQHPVGKFLRSSSLDELPELFNILCGQMSFVGPRPLLIEYLPLYNSQQSRRHEVLPGLTGWAQIKGRNLLSWEDKFTFDVWYVDHQSFILDLRILLLTVIKVVRREGVNPRGRPKCILHRQFY